MTPSRRNTHGIIGKTKINPQNIPLQVLLNTQKIIVAIKYNDTKNIPIFDFFICAVGET